MLAAIIVYGLQQGTFDLTQMGPSANDWLFLGFAIAFAIKAPLWPFHGWLPDAYRESPPEVAGLLSGVVSKVAAYGFLRIAIVKFPGPTHDFRVPILVLCRDRARLRLAARVPGARHPRRRRLLLARPDGPDRASASSPPTASASTARCCRWSTTGSSRCRSSCSPGWSSGGRRPASSRGSAGWPAAGPRSRPSCMTVGVMALAVPLSSNFAGEFLILAGVFQQGWGWAVVGAVAIVLAAMYMLRLISAVLHREVGPAVSDAALDLRSGELAIVVPLVAILLVLSAWPAAISGHAFGHGGYASLSLGATQTGAAGSERK